MSEKSPLPITDKLVEFAKETLVQKQMTNSMNSAISNLRIPGVGNSMNSGNKTSKTKEEESNEN